MKNEKELIKDFEDRLQSGEERIEQDRKYLEAYKKVLDLSNEQIFYDVLVNGKTNIEIDGLQVIKPEIELLRRVLEKLYILTK